MSGALTRSRRRKLATIFDTLGAQHSATPDTPPQAPAAPASATVLSTDQPFIDRGCIALYKDGFDAKVAKSILGKIMGDKSEKFTGKHNHDADVFASLLCIPEANGLLFATVVRLTAPRSPAHDWAESSATASPDDGKRALLEVARRLTTVTAPLDSLRTLLAITFPSGVDPDANIAEFNACLRDVQKSGVLNDDEVKQHFLTALDKRYYQPVYSESNSDIPHTAYSGQDIEAHLTSRLDNIEHMVQRVNKRLDAVTKNNYGGGEEYLAPNPPMQPYHPRGQKRPD
ncbi:hypothetical protein CYMTET_9360 [Cymbomonas tetramitiformis]|uniref:Uncharacterized protein n=1 Tax=Cymbomonas tetramitiformis TaxID=36881 RepID=A0AAE0GR71_9CHLO|nr:hypothetical protein CYMTET_9360 [Cymbomonas tetramitiformis]